jgi:competence protein ComEC
VERGALEDRSLAWARGRAGVAFACVAAGLVLARFAPYCSSWVWFVGALAGAALAALPWRWMTRVALCGALVLLAGGWLTLRVLERPIGSLATLDDGVVVTLDGVALSGVREAPPAQGHAAFFRGERGRWVFEFDAASLATEHAARDVHGRLWVRVGGGEKPSVRAGDGVRVTGVFRGLPTPGNPGEADLRLLGAQRGFVGSVALTDATLVEARGAVDGAGRVRGIALRTLGAMRDRASAVVDRAAGEDAGARFLLRGLLLGDYDPAQREVREAFARVGLAHVLAISGFHLAVMAGVALMLVRVTGERGVLEPLLVAGLVVAYACVVPASSPILRAAAMVLALLAAESFGRRYDRLTLLGWIAIGLLAWRPLDLWALGYQLSVGLTAVLLWLGGRFDAALWGETLRGLSGNRELGAWAMLRGAVRGSASAALLCWLAGTPVLMHAIGLVSPAGIPATMLVVPLVVVLLWVGYVTLLAGVVVPAAAEASGVVLARLGEWVVLGVRAIDALPLASVRVAPVSGAWAAGATLLVLAWARWGSVRRARWWVAMGVLGCWLGAEWSLLDRTPPGVVLRVEMFDVGDATTMLVRSGRDAMLWDAGGPVRGGARSDLARAGAAVGVSRVRTLVLTHPDLDHYSRATQAPALGVTRVLIPARFEAQARVPGSGAAGVLEALRGAGVEVYVLRAGDTFGLGHARVTVLSPPEGADWSADNEHSLAALIEAPVTGGVRRVLLTGDAMDAALTRLGMIVPAPIDVLELPHHGSARPAAVSFVRTVDPRVVLQSTGPGRVGDPRWDGVRPGRVWLSTAERGWARVDVRADGEIAWRTWRE